MLVVNNCIYRATESVVLQGMNRCIQTSVRCWNKPKSGNCHARDISYLGVLALLVCACNPQKVRTGAWFSILNFLLGRPLAMFLDYLWVYHFGDYVPWNLTALRSFGIEGSLFRLFILSLDSTEGNSRKRSIHCHNRKYIHACIYASFPFGVLPAAVIVFSRAFMYFN